MIPKYKTTHLTIRFGWEFILESYLCVRQLSVLPFWKLIKCRPCTDLQQAVRVDWRGYPLHELPDFPLFYQFTWHPSVLAFFIHFIPAAEGLYYQPGLGGIHVTDGDLGTDILIWMKSSVSWWAIVHAVLLLPGSAVQKNIYQPRMYSVSLDTHFVLPVRTQKNVCKCTKLIHWSYYNFFVLLFLW